MGVWTVLLNGYADFVDRLDAFAVFVQFVSVHNSMLQCAVINHKLYNDFQSRETKNRRISILEHNQILKPVILLNFGSV